jgi:uroporphyrinogen-III synthase
MVCKVSEQVSRREQLKIEKKVRILDAAALLFSRRQYHEVMIEDVARIASIAKGTVYNYFSSKEDIYFSIMLERMDKLITSLDQKIRTDTDSRNALHSYVTHLFMFMMRYQDFFLMYRKETLKAENELCGNIAKMKTQLRNMLKNIITRGRERSVFKNIDDGMAADLITGSIFASVNRGIENNHDENDMRHERAELFNFIYEGMSSQAGGLQLRNRTIVLTRTEEQNDESAPIFLSAGAEVISFPVLKIVTLEVEDINTYFSPVPDYIILMSANAAEIFSQKIKENGIFIDRRVTKIAAVGTKTAEACIRVNLAPDFIPQRNNAAGLIEYFDQIDISGKTFLLPRSAIGREEFLEYINGRGAEAVLLNIYDITIPDDEDIPEKKKILFNSEPDVIVFASPSAFRNFLRITGDEGKDLLKSITITAIGSTTAGEITASGYNVDIQPQEYTMNEVKRAIIDFYKKEKL